MTWLLVILLAVVSASLCFWGGYGAARRRWRERMRYVEDEWDKLWQEEQRKRREAEAALKALRQIVQARKAGE